MLAFAYAEVYQIAEPDLLEELEAQKDRAISYLEGGRKELREKIENFEGERLAPASENRTYYIDPTYCLEENIYYRKDGRWEVLYPKGYCFNPVDYIPHDPPPMVVFNPCRKEEREWVEDYLRNTVAVLVASGCPLREVRSQNWKVPVYYLLPDLKKRLRLEHTISVISIDRRRKAIKVEVIDASSGGKGGVPGKGEETF